MGESDVWNDSETEKLAAYKLYCRCYNLRRDQRNDTIHTCNCDISVTVLSFYLLTWSRAVRRQAKMCYRCFTAADNAMTDRAIRKQKDCLMERCDRTTEHRRGSTLQVEFWKSHSRSVEKKMHLCKAIVKTFQTRFFRLSSDIISYGNLQSEQCFSEGKKNL